MLTYVADEARFTECLTGRDYPLVEDGDYEALEHAYLAAGAEAGRPDHGELRRRHRAASPSDGDNGHRSAGAGRALRRGLAGRDLRARASDKATLTNTYWKILRLGDTEVAAGEGRREPNLILREGEPRFTATVGCNQITRQLHPGRRTG